MLNWTKFIGGTDFWCVAGLWVYRITQNDTNDWRLECKTEDPNLVAQYPIVLTSKGPNLEYVKSIAETHYKLNSRTLIDYHLDCHIKPLHWKMNSDGCFAHNNICDVQVFYKGSVVHVVIIRHRLDRVNEDGADVPLEARADTLQHGCEVAEIMYQEYAKEVIKNLIEV
mgnify:CR=1 FL=1